MTREHPQRSLRRKVVKRRNPKRNWITRGNLQRSLPRKIVKRRNPKRNCIRREKLARGNKVSEFEMNL